MRGRLRDFCCGNDMAITPCIFCLVYGVVCGIEDVFGGVAVLWKERDADTDAGVRAGNLKRLANGREDVVGHAHCVTGIVQAGQNHGELVSAQARHGIARAHLFTQAGGRVALPA